MGKVFNLVRGETGIAVVTFDVVVAATATFATLGAGSAMEEARAP